jgi:hypothetical protein
VELLLWRLARLLAGFFLMDSFVRAVTFMFIFSFSLNNYAHLSEYCALPESGCGAMRREISLYRILSKSEKPVNSRNYKTRSIILEDLHFIRGRLGFA